MFFESDDKFRTSVGAFIINKDRNAVLAFERKNHKGSRQLPQGGIKIYEKPINGIYRELYEETGIEAKDLLLLGEYPEWLTFELPEKMRSKKHGRGQTQRYFFFEFQGNELEINLKKVRDVDFSQYFWVYPQDIINKTIDFRKPIHKKLVAFYQDHFENK